MIWKLRFSIVLSCFIFLSGNAGAQGFSFNCTRDTTLPGCPPNLCFTLTGIIPDIHGLSDSYTLNPTSSTPGCFPVYVRPDDPNGTPTNLSIDDRYSAIINMSFQFSFYGTLYNQLVASTNGYVSFDITLANQGSHWQDRGDLPNTQYDRALIMGPYHDLDPSIPAAGQRIQYQEFGTAPHRRWVLSFYRVPLFNCASLRENTHQIILYESTGIIEVSIFSKQICSWQNGKAMVGIQNFTRNSGMTAPLRRMSDPAWGSVGMNESWRFVPNGGASLFRRVELYDLSNNLLATGSTTNLGNGQLQASFPNICPPAGTTTSYIIKSFYTKIDDPNVEIFGTDTVNVDRANGLVANGTAAPATCNQPNGSITVTSASGGTPPYQYSLDNVNWQGGNTFSNLLPGNYTVYVRDAPVACNTNFPLTVGNTGSLSATATSTPTACTGVNNGTITITSASGTGPYTFSLDGGAPVPGTIPFTFNNVPAGNHNVVVTDVSTACATAPIPVTVTTGPGVSGGATTTATSCPTANNGSITVTATSGTAPFTFSLDGGAPQSGPNPYTFNNVPAGIHNIQVLDNFGCPLTLNNVNVPAGPTLTATTTSTATSCSGANNGSITITSATGTGPYTFSLDGGAPVAGTIPFTFNNVSAGSHTIIVTDGAACASNPITEVVQAGPNMTTTATATDVLCNGGSTGTITVAQPTMGNPPYQYSLDNVNWQASNVFSGLIAGSYTVYFREVNGCQGSLTISVNEPTALSASANTTPVVCNGQSNGIISVTGTGGVSPYQYSIDGGTNWLGSGTFNVPAGPYLILIRDANGCTTSRNITVTEPAALTASAATTDASCDGGNDGTITVSANGGNTSYQYSIDGVNFQSSNVFNVAPGNYTVSVKDNLGCSFTFPAVVGLANNLTFTPQTDPTICEGSSVQLNFISNATVYSWTPGTGLSDTTISNPVANPAVTTPYTVTATLGRCSATDIVVVYVNTAPVPDAGAPGFICYGQSYQLQASGGTQYTWTPSSYLDNTSVSNPTSTPPRTMTYILSVADANGCNSLVTDSVTIDVTPPIKVKTYPYDTIGYTGDRFQLLANSPIPNPNYSYSWTPSNGLSDATIPNPLVTVGPIGNDVTYQVTISTPAGCKGEGYVRIRVFKGPDIYTPTGFTPNGDGKNDKLIPFPVGIEKLNYFRVFNRWGQLLFSTTNLHEGWDGRFGGKEQASGVFVWMAEGITKDGKVIKKQGTVMLIR